MLTERQRKAVGLLFELTDEEAARKLKVRPEVLDAWKRDPEFVRAIRERVAENRQSGMRILSELCADICREVSDLIRSGGDANRIKLLVDVLKAAGLFKEAVQAADQETEDDSIGELIERLAGEE